MAVGAIVGLTLGPQSVLLEKDTYRLSDLSQYEIRTDRKDPSTVLAVPQNIPATLRILETHLAVRKDMRGEAVEVPIAARVKLGLSKKSALQDRTGMLSKVLEEGVTPWILIVHTPLEGGGFAISPQPISGVGDKIISVLRPVGVLFMRLIKMVIVPLVFASLLVGIAGLGDIRKLGRMGGKTLLLYLGTTAAAVSIGLLCAYTIQPGNYINEGARLSLMAEFASGAEGRVKAAAESPSLIDNLVQIVPENPIESMADGDMLSLMFFAVVFGIALTLLRQERSQQVVRFFDTVQHAMIIVIHMVMVVAPFGVAALIADVVGNSGASILQALMAYSVTVLFGLAVLAGGLYGGLVRVFAKVRWIAFMRSSRPAQMIAFSTSSSSAALPVTLECAEQNLGVSNTVSSFVVPLGSTINMDGTALYQGVAAVFIAQVFGVDLSLGSLLAMVLAATMASVGAAGVPGAGMITLAMVLMTAGIPAEGVALILGVDRILDMFRSAVNVTGDLAVTTVVAVSEGEAIEVLTPARDELDTGRGFEGRLDKLS